MAAWDQDMFHNFYLAKNHKIANDSMTTKAREQISTDLESLEFKKCFDVCLKQSIFAKQNLPQILSDNQAILWVKDHWTIWQ